jgi:hypothetical protein
MTHFLDETGNIPKQIAKEARELASFFALVIDATTKKFPSSVTQTEIRCFEKRCDGTIKSELLSVNDEIHWICSICQNEGRISGWQGTKWDYQKVSK